MALEQQSCHGMKLKQDLHKTKKLGILHNNWTVGPVKLMSHSTGHAELITCVASLQNTWNTTFSASQPKVFNLQLRSPRQAQESHSMTSLALTNRDQNRRCKHPCLGTDDSVAFAAAIKGPYTFKLAGFPFQNAHKLES